MSIIKQVLDNDWVSLQKDFEQKLSDKIWSRIQDKKVEVLAKINNISVEEMKSSINK